MATSKDSWIPYCNNEDPSENEEWCLDMDEYVPLPAFGRAQAIQLYNPTVLDVQTRTAVLNALMSMNYETYYVHHTTRGQTYTGHGDITIHVMDEDLLAHASEISSQNVLNTDGIEQHPDDHLGSYRFD